MPSLVIVDAGPLFAWADEGDAYHEACLDVLDRNDLSFVIAGLALAEAAYLVNTHLGPRAELALIAGLRNFPVECPSDADLTRMADLMTTYLDFPLGAADASVVALAERLETDLVFTLDRRHFTAIRPRHCDALRLLPA